jgi:hypothetical protein
MAVFKPISSEFKKAEKLLNYITTKWYPEAYDISMLNDTNSNGGRGGHAAVMKVFDEAIKQAEEMYF